MLWPHPDRLNQTQGDTWPSLLTSFQTDSTWGTERATMCGLKQLRPWNENLCSGEQNGCPLQQSLARSWEAGAKSLITHLKEMHPVALGFQGYSIREPCQWDLQNFIKHWKWPCLPLCIDLYNNEVVANCNDENNNITTLLTFESGFSKSHGIEKENLDSGLRKAWVWILVPPSFSSMTSLNLGFLICRTQRIPNLWGC